MPLFENISHRQIIILSNTTTGWTKKEIADSDKCLAIIQQQISLNGFKSKIIFINSSDQLINKLSHFDPKKIVIFNWVEEIDNLKYGYHIVPQLLDEYGFIYTGNNSSTLITSNSKIKTRKLLQKNGVSIPQSISIYQDFRHLNQWNIYPSIIKPAREHCSYGISPKSVVDNKKQLIAQAKTMFAKYHQPLLVEEFIQGPEYFVSTWGYENIEILPLVFQDYSYTTDYHQQINDYASKWNGASDFYQKRPPIQSSTNNPIPDFIKKEVTLAVRTLGYRGYSRFDLRVRNNIAYIIDANPNPDISYDSDFVTAASGLGYNYGQTILRLCDLAIKNFCDSQQISLSLSSTHSKITHPPTPLYATI